MSEKVPARSIVLIENSSRCSMWNRVELPKVEGLSLRPQGP